MKKIKVLHFEIDSTRGGIESFLLNLYLQIDRNKFEFEFVTRADNPALAAEFIKLGGKIHKVPSYFKIKHYMNEIQKLNLESYDVIHIHKNSAANIIPLIVAVKHKAPKIIVHSHNTAPSPKGIWRLFHLINKPYLNRHVSMRIACSKAAGTWMFGNNDFKVLPNGIHTDEFLFDEKKRKATRQVLCIDEETVIIGNVGRFTTQKNHMFLLKILQAAIKVNVKTILLLVGDGDTLSDVESRAKKMELSQNVIFMGARNDISALLSAMDVFVMPSLYEGFPIVGVEAQASGLPLVLSDTISKDIEITDGIKWFSLRDKIENITALIFENSKTCVKDRIRRNQAVKDAGYDIEDTCKYICDYYSE